MIRAANHGSRLDQYAGRLSLQTVLPSRSALIERATTIGRLSDETTVKERNV